jgi:hypothetical protein
VSDADLDALLTGEPGNEPKAALERFLGRTLFEAGVWPSARNSDGIAMVRTIEHVASRLRSCGKVLTIDQKQHVFCLDVRDDDASPPARRWTLYFDIDPSSATARRARLAVESMNSPDEFSWLVTLTGS